MTKRRTDHVAEARKRINGGHIAEAQVHATLALVEQQRVANLIALGGVSATTIGSAKAMAELVNEGMGW